MSKRKWVEPTPNTPSEDDDDRRARHLFDVVLMIVLPIVGVAIGGAYLAGVNTTTILVVCAIVGAFGGTEVVLVHDWFKTKPRKGA